MPEVIINKKLLRFKPTKRNKGLEPVYLENFGAIGYDQEIHGDDSLEFNYLLPIGAIKRLIKSYFEDMESIDQSSTYGGMTGSYEIRMRPYCNQMLNEIEKQLNTHRVNGRKIIDEVFEAYFKKSYDEMKVYSKNHDHLSYEDFKPCNDTKCCNYSYSFYYKLKVAFGLLKQVMKILSFKYVEKNKSPYIGWH